MALLTNIDPRATGLQDLVYDFQVPNDVLGSIYEETSRNHIPLLCNIQQGMREVPSRYGSFQPQCIPSVALTFALVIISVHFNKVSCNHGKIGGGR